jgi:branched-chain amino acid transport system ATP-binding protein
VPEADGVRDGALRVHQVSMSFRRVRALEGVSLEIPAGGRVGIIGPNGAGKTTLVNCVSGIYQPTAGSIHLGEERIDRKHPHEIVRLGLVRTFQTVEQFSSITVLDLVLTGRHQRFQVGAFRAAVRSPAYRREERREREIARRLLDRFGLRSLENVPIAQVPFGSRKLVDLTRALASEPRMLILDEPGAGVNATEKATLRDMLRSSQGGLFESLILIDHDVEFVRNVCDRAVVLDFGHKIAEGQIDDVLASDSVREAYLGV